MLKKTAIVLAIPLLSVLIIAVSLCRSALGSSPTAARPQNSAATAPATGTLQKMIVENGSVTMDLDLNGLSGDSSLVARPMAQQFLVGANSFFPILVFNDLLRGLEPGSMALIPAGVNAPGYGNLPAALGASFKRLVVEKLPSGQGFDLAVCDGNTGFTFFNVEGHDTTTTPLRRRLPLRMAGCSFQRSLPTRLAVHRTPVQWLEKSLSARQCKRSRSTV